MTCMSSSSVYLRGPGGGHITDMSYLSGYLRVSRRGPITDINCLRGLGGYELFIYLSEGDPGEGPITDINCLKGSRMGVLAGYKLFIYLSEGVQEGPSYSYELSIYLRESRRSELSVFLSGWGLGGVGGFSVCGISTCKQVKFLGKIL